MPNNDNILVEKIMWKSENKRHNSILRKQEWLKVQHLCLELCHFF